MLHIICRFLFLEDASHRREDGSTMLHSVVGLQFSLSTYIILWRPDTTFTSTHLPRVSNKCRWESEKPSKICATHCFSERKRACMVIFMTQIQNQTMKKERMKMNGCEKNKLQRIWTIFGSGKINLLFTNFVIPVFFIMEIYCIGGKYMYFKLTNSVTLHSVGNQMKTAW